jgi:hypothetical protein
MAISMKSNLKKEQMTNHPKNEYDIFMDISNNYYFLQFLFQKSASNIRPSKTRLCLLPLGNVGAGGKCSSLLAAASLKAA